MGARTRLNRAYFNGSLVVAGLVGLVAQSWPLFFVALAVLLASNLYSGEIRPGLHSCRQKTQKSRRGEKA